MIAKTLLMGCFLLSFGFSAYSADKEDDIARQIIKSNGGRHSVAGLSGRATAPNGEVVLSGPLVSGAILRKLMLSDEVGEKVRIAYAMELLNIWDRNRKAVLSGIPSIDWFDRTLVSEPKYEYMRMEPNEVREHLKALYNKLVEQDDADQPATALDSKSDGKEKVKPESEGRSR